MCACRDNAISEPGWEPADGQVVVSYGDADMARSNSNVLSLMALVAITASGHFCCAQASSAGDQPKVVENKSAHIAVSIALLQKKIPAGQKPSVVLTVENLGGNVTIAFPKDRVQVEGEAGEPPTTLYQRQVTQTLRPGEPQLRMGGFEPEIWPTFSSDRKYDLSLFYDLSKPGKYTVYIEVLDVSAAESKHGAGLWVRSKTVPFEIQAPN